MYSCDLPLPLGGVRGEGLKRMHTFCLGEEAATLISTSYSFDSQPDSGRYLQITKT